MHNLKAVTVVGHGNVAVESTRGLNFLIIIYAVRLVGVQGVVGVVGLSFKVRKKLVGFEGTREVTECPVARMTK